MTIYEVKVTNQDGTEETLEKYKDKVLLIVNTATGCGFTPQYEGLEKLYQNYRQRGLEILDFPCNQFLGQAPGSDADINQFCSLRYHTSFKRFKKINVNGKDAAPIFKYLKEHTKGIMGNNIKWNFTKFLVNKNGDVIKRYAPTVTPEEIEKDIIDFLMAD